jgi:hypothetical protein
MAFEKAIQSLSFIEEKLRRAFSLAGNIGARLDPVLSPVIIAHDLREPGHASHLGRCWSWCFDSGTPAGVSVVSALFGADVLIEAVQCGGEIAVGGLVELYVTTPTETIPIAVTGPNGAWRDRKVVAADVPPITSPAAWGALTGTAIANGNRLAQWFGGVAAVGRDNTPREMKIMVPAGGALTWRSTTASSAIRVGMWGRIWP